MKHDDGVPLVELALGEAPAYALEDYGGGGGGVINEGHFFDAVGIDEFLDNSSGMEDGLLEVVEEETVRLLKELELPPSLGSENGGRAASEAAVVDSGDAVLVVGKLLLDLELRYQGQGC